MSTRRPHTKTRDGCGTCKARKVRCDLERPICRNCTRGNRPCHYPNQVLALPSALGATSADAQIFPVRDMELLHHYTSIVYSTMTDRADDDHLWQDAVPRLAFSYPFLLHGLLAVSALHRRHESEGSQRQPLMNVARYHQQHALNLYIPMLQNIDEQNCHALFAFSIVTAIICFGMLSDEEETAPPLVIRVIDMFDALSGTAVVAEVAWEWLHHGPMKVILERTEPVRENLDGLEPGLRSSLDLLLDRAETACLENHDPSGLDAATRRKAYHNSIYSLGSIAAPLVFKDRPFGVAMCYPILSGNAYISLLRHRDPLALAILAHYGVVLHQVDYKLWAFEGIGQQLTTIVAKELDDQWLPCLAWAKARVTQPVTPVSDSTITDA
ncbi:Sterol uptake control protein 2 [Cercospora beticola]|uniref:Sterol uptake control protein 2 n=2 Tax=Cercospora beticola TaxID=122368 RepID=A0A2G5HI52_CERBT|nr:Sterol uptake control protein 2 [Cercospora beticola]PIA91883.1 Sterol uptake control protein 2 [Cercospora beticola]